MRKIEPSDTRPRYRGPFYRSPATKEKKIGKCTPCISHGTISRSSLESRIRFLPSSMLAILALCSPPGIAVAGTPDIPPANAPIPATFVGIVAVCIFFRIFFIFHTRSFDFFRFHVFFFRDTFLCVQISFLFFTVVHRVFPCIAVHRPHPFPFSAVPETSPVETFSFSFFFRSCVSTFIHILLYRCGVVVMMAYIYIFFFSYF